MSPQNVFSKHDINPDQRKITKLQSERLAALSGVKATELVGNSIAKLSEKLKWKIDPHLFLFRKVCGKVVKKDPVTGVEYPVPFATVYVEDTDCNLISFFPIGWQWTWHFPFFCNREVIATTKTDSCGNFCVWIPRFDIDWILKWRKERICFPLIFRRPLIKDLIPRLPEEYLDGPWPPIPDPDPGPLRDIEMFKSSVIEALAGITAKEIAERVFDMRDTKTLGAPALMAENLMQTRAFEGELPPPLPAEFHNVISKHDTVAAKKASAEDGMRSAIALKAGLNISAKEIAGLSPQKFIGPFFRCYDIFLPEWQLITDVPDITFRVEQDVNGDGNEEVIYSESYFDVRWDETSIPDVTLMANSNAKETHLCESPVVPCGNVPAILFAGFMPLSLPTYFDGAIAPASVPPFQADVGYAVRPNRPKLGTLRPSAKTPFCRTLQFHGCVDVQQAKYYRILRSDNGGTSFSAIAGLAWNNYHQTGGAPIVISADSNGWYEVNPVDSSSNTIPRQDLEFPNLLLDWSTPLLGQSILKLETGDASKTHMAYSESVAVQVDNTRPSVNFSKLAWKFVGESDSALRELLGNPCPTIRRGVVPQDIELVFETSVSANHLRNAYIYTHGCGSGNFAEESTDLLNNPTHWHTSTMDNSVLLHQRYTLDASALEGSYTFACRANSRAMNPSGADGCNSVPPDWYCDPVYLYSHPHFGVAVINGD